MSKFSGFLQLRRGIFEHLRDGRMSHMEVLALIYIATQADTRDGTWKGSAGALAGELVMSPRTARDVLEKLSKKGYLKSWAVPGKHSCYPIAVHKYLSTTGEHAGERVDALSSTGPADDRWFAPKPREENGEQSDSHSGKDGGEQSAAQKRRKNLV
jgi:hypothetical protein